MAICDCGHELKSPTHGSSFCNEDECTCVELRVGGRLVVACDEGCGAVDEPTTPEELKAAYIHWKGHALLGGCSHSR